MNQLIGQEFLVTFGQGEDGNPVRFVGRYNGQRPDPQVPGSVTHEFTVVRIPGVPGARTGYSMYIWPADLLAMDAA